MRDPALHKVEETIPPSLSLQELCDQNQVNSCINEEIAIEVDGVEYVLIQHRENFLNLGHGSVTLVLVYLVRPGQVVSKIDLEEWRTTKLEKDDVFQRSFYNTVVFYGAEKKDVEVKPDALETLAAWDTKAWKFVKGEPHSQTRSGPYIGAMGQTWQPWRVYRDFNGIFMCAFKPSPHIKLDPPQAGLNGRVIVPSRCYFDPSESHPLDGARISVKDNIDIAGHKTTLCNRAWEDLYPPKSKHADCVQTLVDAGAIIVGKAKLQAMIMREEPLECVEFTAPFNPRGDGYQVPSGSSHASAAGIGSYDWLDFSLGSDTNGSGRKPASYNGCFSIRPSTGILNTHGVIGQFNKFDMPVFFGRDLSKFSEFISVWYGSSPMLRHPTKTNVKILYPLDYLPTSNESQSRLIDNFVGGLEIALGVARTEISLIDKWKAESPDGKENADLPEYLRLTGGYPYYRDAYYDLHEFRTMYEMKHGKPPFVHRAMRWQWDIAKTISVEERDFYWRRSELYRHWLLDRIFDAENKDCITIMVFPIEEGMPNYRDSVPPPFSILSGYASLNMSPMMRAPELTAIIGETTFQSLVTNKEEPLPVAASVIGAPGELVTLITVSYDIVNIIAGTDLYLADLVQKGMEAAGLVTSLKTGGSVY